MLGVDCQIHAERTLNSSLDTSNDTARWLSRRENGINVAARRDILYCVWRYNIATLFKRDCAEQ